MSDLSRRDTLVFAGACACCAMTANALLADDDGPKRGGDKTPAPKSLEIGKLTDYDKPGYYDKFAKQKVMIARLDDRLVALTPVCTHKGCTVKVQPDHTTLKCPCHKAEFSPEGTPTAGPARTALSRFALTQDDKGVITVDTTKTFIESKWEDPAAFIPVKKN